jgi:hypothetical protein
VFAHAKAEYFLCAEPETGNYLWKAGKWGSGVTKELFTSPAGTGGFDL